MPPNLKFCLEAASLALHGFGSKSLATPHLVSVQLLSGPLSAMDLFQQ